MLRWAILLACVAGCYANANHNPTPFMAQRIAPDKSTPPSIQCITDLRALWDGTYPGGQYMLDAWGKPSSGILVGDFQWLGAFQECASVPTGRYCLLIASLTSIQTPSFNQSFPPTNGFPDVQWGTCLPESCGTTGDFQNIIDYATKYLASHNNITIVTELIDGFCYEAPTWDAGAIAVLCLLLVFAFLGVGCTVLDYAIEYRDKQKRNNIQLNTTGFLPVTSSLTAGQSHVTAININADEEPDNEKAPLLTTQNAAGGGASARPKKKKRAGIDFIKCFSLKENLPKLFSMKEAQGTVTSLNGVRCLSMMWVLLGHTFLFMELTGTDNPLHVLKISDRFTMMAIRNGFFSVDSFFFISGFLVSYLLVAALIKGTPKFSLWKLYVVRFLRLTPSYMIVLGVWTTLTQFFIPASPKAGYATATGYNSNEPCNQYWWTNILYINNFYPFGGDTMSTCMGWTWYLADDMQFYLLAPFLLLLLHRRPKLGYIATGLTLAVCLITTFVLSMEYHLKATMTDGPDTTGNYAHIIYVKPYTRAAPYLVGLLLGYFFNRVNPAHLPLTKWVLLVGNLLCGFVFMSVLYGLYGLFNGTEEWSNSTHAFYITTSRMAWALALAWLTTVCAAGKGGVVNTFLSAPLWSPLGRLTYSCYLIHPIVLNTFFLGLQTPIHYQDLVATYFYLGNLMMTYMCGFVVTAFIEFPLGALQKRFLR